MWKWISGIIATVLSGVLIWAITQGPKPKQETVRSSVNTSYLAELVGKEPFLEQLPKPLKSLGFADVLISDDSAVRKLKAVQLKISPAPGQGETQDLQIFAHIEVYRSKKEAQARANARWNSLAKEYDPGLGKMSGESFCVLGNDFWVCGGYREFAYAEVTLSPSINAFRGIATGTVSALLRYTDKMMALASN
jgi:hypothetical protein